MAERTSVDVHFSDRQQKIKTISAAYTVGADETGTVFILDAAAGAAVTLPPLEDGLSFEFIVGAAFATTDWVISSSEGDNINGILIVNGASVPAAGEDNITFELAAESVGDFVRFVADAGNSQWLVYGIANAAASASANDPA